MTVPDPPGPLALRILRWFWVPITPDASNLPRPARVRARAARASLLLGEHGLQQREARGEPLDPSAALLASLGCLRAALELGLRDARGVDNVDALLDAPAGHALAPDRGERERLRSLLGATSLRALSDGSEGPLLDEVERAAEFTRAALSPLLEREASRAERLRARASRVGILLLSILAVVAVGPGVRRALKPDLAPTARWRASSTMGALPQQGTGFHPREGEGNFFFQTQIESEPSIEFDLGATRRIESVTVQNRLDCCQDWAVPLVVEIAGPTRQWREVGRRVESFYFYTTNFRATDARFVRVRVPRMTSLHLGAVKIR